jgi:hypothetical protein
MGPADPGAATGGIGHADRPDRSRAQDTRVPGPPEGGQIAPVVAGLSCDVPKPGDMLVFDAVGPSILIVRGSLDTQGVKNRKQARSRYGAKKEKS